MKKPQKKNGLPSKLVQLSLFDNSVEPPLPNRGVNQQQGVCLGLDWIQGTFPLAKVEEFRKILDFWFGDRPLDDRAIPFRGFNHVYGRLSGVSMSWDPNSTWGFVRISGSGFDGFDQLSAFALLRDFTDAGMKPTRIDLFRDDYDKKVHPSEFLSLCKEGLLRGKRVYGYHESYDGKDRGATLTVGRRGDKGDGCFARYYDKSQHKADRSDCYRLELEFTGQKAQVVCQVLRGGDGDGTDGLPSTVEGILLGQFHFIKDGTVHRSSQYEPHERWTLFVGSSCPIRIAKPTKSRVFQRTVRAFVTQWGGFLSGISTLGLRTLFDLVAKAINDSSGNGFRSSINTEGRKINPSVAIGLFHHGVDGVARIAGRGYGGPLKGDALLRVS